MEHLTTWIKAKRGRLSRLSERVKVTPSAISQWTEVPAERMGDDSRITGIPLRKLRPDIFERAMKPTREGAAA